jgi:hypothetical protein
MDVVLDLSKYLGCQRKRSQSLEADITDGSRGVLGNENLLSSAVSQPFARASSLDV